MAAKVYALANVRATVTLADGEVVELSAGSVVEEITRVYSDNLSAVEWCEQYYGYLGKRSHRSNAARDAAEDRRRRRG